MPLPEVEKAADRDGDEEGLHEGGEVDEDVDVGGGEHGQGDQALEEEHGGVAGCRRRDARTGIRTVGGAYSTRTTRQGMGVRCRRLMSAMLRGM